MPIHEAPTGMRARLEARRILAELPIILLLAVMLAAMGPFGTFIHGTWPVRLAYWLRTVLAGYLLFRPGVALFAALACRLGFSERAGWAAAVVVLSVPMALYLWFFGPHIMPDRPWPGTEDFMETYAQVIFLGALAMAVLWWRAAPASTEALAAPAGGSIPAQDAATPAAPPSGIGPLLAERLPPHIGQEVIALQMEDHYVRVHTTRGEALILMRMADAVAALEGVDGLRVHRSWWAARNAVVGVERKGRAVTLTLANGLKAPVARDRLPQLRDSGWLEE